jgi:hypothetical protein
MSAAPRKISLVVVGQFNQAILVPSWLAKHGIIEPTGAQTQVQIDPGGEVQMRHRSGPLEWRVERGRLTVEVRAILGEDVTAELASLVGFATAILEKLPHTPVIAVGYNFYFDLAETIDCAAGTLRIGDVASALKGQPLTSSVRFSCAAEGDVKMNVELGNIPIPRTPATEQVARYNFHAAAGSVDEVIAIVHRGSSWLDRAAAAQRELKLTGEK